MITIVPFSPAHQDGVVATIMALGRAIRCAGHDTIASVYDERGLLVL